MSDMDPHTDHASLLYRTLPALLQKRVQKVPSLRRSLSWASKPTTPHPGASPPIESDGTVTPPPSYRCSDASLSWPDGAPATATLAARPSCAASASGCCATAGGAEDGSAIDWKYADQGN